MKKVLLLVGGNSSEHKVSCISAKSILENIDYEKYEVTTCCIDRNNDWYIYKGEAANIVDWKKEDIYIAENIINLLKSFDVVFPIIHGETGEDGKLQGMLDFFNIRYIGSKTLASSVGMDKEFAKIIFNGASIPQVEYLVLDSNYNENNIINKINLPLIVKPANGGSSIGITKVNTKEELIPAIEEAKKYDKKIIIEKFIKARELECAILSSEEMIIGTIGEIVSANDFYDYNAKYENEKSTTLVPAEITEELSDKIKKYAVKAFKAINARGLARIDFFYDVDNDQIYLNEINTLPGFTTISMYPKLLMHTGLTYKELISKLIESAYL